MEPYEFARILIATDGTEAATSALDLAASLAKASSEPRVWVVHVSNLEVRHRHGVLDEELRRTADQLLNNAIGRLRSLGVEAEGHLARADRTHVSAAIAEMARQFGADLVVVGSRGLSDWESLVGHGVSHGLVTSLDCPVLIVRAGSESSSRQPKRVLLAVAGGDDVDPGVRAAAAAARASGSTVLVTHVLRAATSEHGVSFAEPAEHASGIVDAATRRLREAGVETDARVLKPGPVAQGIADAATRWRADIVVIGSSRMGDLGSLLFESVTHELLRATDLPLLVAGSPGRP